MFQQIRKYHTASFIVTILAAIAAFHFYGFAGFLSVLMLGLIETSVSLDNAVFNMTILKNWDDKWRKIFLWVGLPIAVFGMRFVFPLCIVSVAASLGLTETFNLAVNDSAQYGQILQTVHPQIAAFGGMFLLCIAAGFFIDSDKEDHFIPKAEQLFAKIKYPLVVTGTAMVAFIAGYFQQIVELKTVMAAAIGMISYYGLHFLSDKLSDGVADGVIKQGLIGLLYIELVDASFSLDGVIAAFAVSTNIFIIMLGLGIGAMFVRSFTIQLLDNEKVATLKYLEHGAFWAILTLVGIMFYSMFSHVNEFVAAGAGIFFIGMAVWKSLVELKKGAIA